MTLRRLLFAVALALPLPGPSAAQGDVPVTPVPPGYGRYCSVLYASGGMAFATGASQEADPCGDLLRSSPGGTVERAGLWSVNGDNNALLHCSDGFLQVHRGTGGIPITTVYNLAGGHSGCVITVSPTALPVFSLPYGRTTPNQADPSSDVRVARGFDYNVYRIPMDVSMFGQPQTPSLPAVSVDRRGRQRNFIGDSAQCAPSRRPAGCNVIPGEAAWDWPMPEGKPITAVADGVVRGARARDVSTFDCGDDQQVEVYIEHQVGTGDYAERFISYYAHMLPPTSHLAAGTRVVRGQVIGRAGNTGCSGGNHLHLSVWRLSNLSGQRFYTFQITPGGYGVNGIHGAIDPFGWAAPRHIDPFGWMFIGQTFNDPNMGPVRNPGAFSINLWRPGEAPPSDWGM
jgi:murein DD-endopeptidase MepM/ murein hydrolase activator NlpD